MVDEGGMGIVFLTFFVGIVGWLFDFVIVL
jgi:hypothetical protein